MRDLKIDVDCELLTADVKLQLPFEGKFHKLSTADAQMHSLARTGFLLSLLLSVMVYILLILLGGFSRFKTDIMVNKYFTIFENNQSQFTQPKPVLYHAVESTKRLVVENTKGLAVESSKGLTVESAEGLAVENTKGLAMESSKGLAVESTKWLATRPRNVTDYERGHVERCQNSWQANYTSLHNRLLETNQNRFLIYVCTKAGWGNRLRDLFTAFHFAVVTRRAFIIRCDRPSPLDKYLEPRNIKWNAKFNESKLSVKGGRMIILNNHKNPNATMLERMLNYSIEYAPIIRGGVPLFLSRFVKYKLPVWPDLRQMMGCSFYYLFKKSDILQNRIEELKQELGFNDNIVIAIHIREGDSVSAHSRVDKRFKSMMDIDLSFDCASRIEKKIEENYKTKKIIWFLAADSEKMKTYARNKYGDKVKHISGPIEHIGHPSKGNADAGHLSMFLDFFLLQESDYRLYPGHSTFDNAVDYITLGTDNTASMVRRGQPRVCRMPYSLNT